jgi:hypothetical protein
MLMMQICMMLEFFCKSHLLLNLIRKEGTQKGARVISYPLTLIRDATDPNLIDSCYLSGNDLNQEVNESFDEVCTNGPGTMDFNGECRFKFSDLEINCHETMRSYGVTGFTTVTNTSGAEDFPQTISQCGPLIGFYDIDSSGNFQEVPSCPIGFRIDASGRHICIDINDMVDSSPVAIPDGGQCSLGSVNGKIALSCNTCAACPADLAGTLGSMCPSETLTCGTPCQSYAGTSPDPSCTTASTNNCNATGSTMCCPNQQIQCCGSAGDSCFEGLGSLITGTGGFDDGRYAFDMNACSSESGYEDSELSMCEVGAPSMSPLTLSMGSITFADCATTMSGSFEIVSNTEISVDVQVSGATIPNPGAVVTIAGEGNVTSSSPLTLSPGVYNFTSTTHPCGGPGYGTGMTTLVGTTL